MASPSAPGQPSGSDPGAVLCDNCKKPVLEPSQHTDDVPFGERIHQALAGYMLSPGMWPVGYIIGSPYSPFRVELELPTRDWRNAFEDLLALESDGEMISHESREQEKAVAAKHHWQRANVCIDKINKLTTRDNPGHVLLQNALNQARSPGYSTDPSMVSWMEEKFNEVKRMAQYRIRIAEAFKSKEAICRQSSASQSKDRGQWIASLVPSGALRGWSSSLQDSDRGDVIHLSKESVDSEDSGGLSFTEAELYDNFVLGERFTVSSPGPPLYEVPHRPRGVPVDGDQLVDESSFARFPPDEPSIVTKTPERAHFYNQTTNAERITLPSGKMATRVVMKTYFTNGDVEEKVMVQEPGNVLKEVEKARAMIQDRMLGLD